MSTTIDGSTNLPSPTGTEKIPVGNGSGNPLSITFNQIKGAAPVQSVAGRTGIVTLSTSDISGIGSISTSGSAGSLANNTANTLAGFNNTGVYTDVAIGSGLSLSAGTLSASGGIPSVTNNNSIILGANSGTGNTGTGNTGIGYASLNGGAGGNFNTAVGYGALQSDATGGYNTAVGATAMENTNGSQYCTVIGYQALCGSGSASTNTVAVGYNAGYYNTTGNNNVYVGTAAGADGVHDVTSGSGNTLIGTSSGVSGAGTAVNRIAIGYQAIATIDNTWIAGPIGTKQCIAEGSNAAMGLATLVGGTVTVANTLVTTNSRIFYNIQAAAGTVGALAITARVNGTSFTISSLSPTDTSTVAWEIKEPA